MNSQDYIDSKFDKPMYCESILKKQKTVSFKLAKIYM